MAPIASRSPQQEKALAPTELIEIAEVQFPKLLVLLQSSMSRKAVA